jgi:hypothetical protein
MKTRPHLTPDLADAVRADARSVKDALGRWHASNDYYNFEGPQPKRAPSSSAFYHRLQKIKVGYDPGQAIISPRLASRGLTMRTTRQDTRVG